MCACQRRAFGVLHKKKVGVLGKSLVNRDQYFPSMYALLGVTDYLLPGKSTI